MKQMNVVFNEISNIM